MAIILLPLSSLYADVVLLAHVTSPICVFAFFASLLCAHTLCSSEKKPKQIWQQLANSSNNVARKKTYGFSCSLNQNMDKLHLNVEVFCHRTPVFQRVFRPSLSARPFSRCISIECVFSISSILMWPTLKIWSKNV